MNILKIVAIVIACIIAIPLLIALFIPKTYTVSVSMEINQPRQKVYDYVRILNNQKDYSIWVMADPNLNPVITGTDGTVGATQSWNSKVNDVGEGQQEITALSPERMDVDLRFVRPFRGNSKASYFFKDAGEDKTELTAEFYSTTTYPLNLPAYVFGKSMIEKAQKQNLQNIKNNLEKI